MMMKMMMWLTCFSSCVCGGLDFDRGRVFGIVIADDHRCSGCDDHDLKLFAEQDYDIAAVTRVCYVRWPSYSERA